MRQLPLKRFVYRRFDPRAEGDLGIPLHLRARLVGTLKWQVLDERGIPEVPRNPSGFAIGPVEGVEQRNLITNAGMNSLTSFNCATVEPTSGWRRYLRIGTGTVEPAFTDVSLGNQVQVESTSGSFATGARTGQLNTTDNTWVMNLMVTRVVTMNADRNITEFGLSPEIAGDLSIRELFRDGGGTPITISLLNGKAIRVDHTLQVVLPAPASGNAVTINREEYDATNALTATVPMDVIHGGWVPSVTNENLAGGIVPLVEYWNPFVANTIGIRRVPASWAYTRVGSIVPAFDPSANVSASAVSLSLGAYTPDSYQRVKRGTLGAGQLNTQWHAVAFTRHLSPADIFAMWLLIFSSPSSYTKADTNTLRFGLVSTWARG
jgi:hypothetical protein